MKDKQFSTRLIHNGETSPPSVSRSKSLPIAMTSVYAFDDVETLDQVYDRSAQGYIYTRNGNPVHDALSEIVASIEEGEAALSYSSGMAAISLSILSHVQPGDHILAASALYGGTFQLLKAELSRLGITTTFVNPVDEDLTPHFRANTRLVYVETIANPTMEVVDLPRIASVAHAMGAKLIVDNSFATPIICQPLLLGADIVVYSATKYIGGHSDVTAGIVVSDRATIDRIYACGLLFGPTLSPFDGWLLVRSLRTLELRMKKHSDNALRLAEYFQTHPAILAVHYPGLPSSPTRPTAEAQFNNNLYGGMLSIDLEGGERAAYELLRRLETIKFVPSLAGVATSTSYPAKTSHRALDDGELLRAGISKGLIRVSAGLENPDDIIADFRQALS